MNAGAPTLRGELPGWILRGVLCALSSLYWALLTGFRHPWEILGMAAGIAGWVLVYAWLTFHVLPARGAGGRWVLALKRAVWIKFGLTAGGWALFAGLSAAKSPGLTPLATLAMADVWLGVASLTVVTYLGGFSNSDQIATLDSFGWTALTTVVDGMLFAIIISVITALVLGWWWARQGHTFERSPVRPADQEGAIP